MRIAIRIVIGFVVLLLVCVGGLIWYVAPQEQLDMKYVEVDFEHKLQGLVRSTDPEMILSEWEMNQYLKQWMSEHKQLSSDLTLDGIRSALDHGQLKLHLNLKYAGMVRIGVILQYQLQWKHPDLVGTLQSATIRDYKLNSDWIPMREIVFPVANQLPNWAEVKDVSMEQGRFRIHFALDPEVVAQFRPDYEEEDYE